MALRTTLSGTVVKTESEPWDFNGKSGIAHAIFVRCGGPEDGAQRVRVTAEQVGAFAADERVTDLPVVISAVPNDFGGAKLRVSLPRDYTHTAASSPRPRAVAG